MADHPTRIIPQALTPPVSGGKRSAAPPSRAAPRGYAQADEVARRANVLGDQDTPQNQASLKRLKRALDSHQPLRGDVPRGYYLNIRV